MINDLNIRAVDALERIARSLVGLTQVSSGNSSHDLDVRAVEAMERIALALEVRSEKDGSGQDDDVDPIARARETIAGILDAQEPGPFPPPPPEVPAHVAAEDAARASRRTTPIETMTPPTPAPPTSTSPMATNAGGAPSRAHRTPPETLGFRAPVQVPGPRSSTGDLGQIAPPTAGRNGSSS